VAGPDPVSELYRVDPDDFVATRNRLAKELKAEGRKDEAADVARLRRPSPSAWALNQVARDRPELVDAVLDAGAALRGAMEEALGGDASGVREAQAGERRAVDAAVVAAAGVLAAAGKAATDALKLRIAASLRAAVVDDDVADLVRRGVLDADRDAPGFGLDGFSVAATPAAARRTARPAAKRASPPATADEADRDPARQAKAEEAERRRITAEADEAEDRARRLEREAADAERQAAQLAEASEAAAAEAEKATERAARLGSDASEAARRARDARVAADAAETAARDARRRAEGG
jgi:hypothetical protein